MIRTTSEGGGNRPQSAEDRQPGPYLSGRLRDGATNKPPSSKTSLLAWEAGAIIGAWPSCPRFASRRVDRLTLALDCLLGREVRL